MRFSFLPPYVIRAASSAGNYVSEGNVGGHVDFFFLKFAILGSERVHGPGMRWGWVFLCTVVTGLAVGEYAAGSKKAEKGSESGQLPPRRADRAELSGRLKRSVVGHGGLLFRSSFLVPRFSSTDATVRKR